MTSQRCWCRQIVCKRGANVYITSSTITLHILKLCVFHSQSSSTEQISKILLASVKILVASVKILVVSVKILVVSVKILVVSVKILVAFVKRSNILSLEQLFVGAALIKHLTV